MTHLFYIHATTICFISPLDDRFVSNALLVYNIGSRLYHEYVLSARYIQLLHYFQFPLIHNDAPHDCGNSCLDFAELEKIIPDPLSEFWVRVHAFIDRHFAAVLIPERPSQCLPFVAHGLPYSNICISRRGNGRPSEYSLLEDMHVPWETRRVE